MGLVMSVQPQLLAQPAAKAVAAVAVMYRGRRERPLPVMVRDQLGEWLSDEQFAERLRTDGVGRAGRWGGWALVTIFQMAEDLTDRQAAEAVRTRIDWKYALGLGLADPELRRLGLERVPGPGYRMRRAGAGGAGHCCWSGWLAGGLPVVGGKMRTDSTHVISAVRDLNRLELAGESVRACLEALRGGRAAGGHAATGRLVGKRYAARIDTWRMPAPADEERPAGAGLRPGRLHAAEGGVCRRRSLRTWRSWCGCIRSRYCGSCSCRTTSPPKTSAGGR